MFILGRFISIRLSSFLIFHIQFYYTVSSHKSAGKSQAKVKCKEAYLVLKRWLAI